MERWSDWVLFMFVSCSWGSEVKVWRLKVSGCTLVGFGGQGESGLGPIIMLAIWESRVGVE